MYIPSYGERSKVRYSRQKRLAWQSRKREQEERQCETFVQDDFVIQSEHTTSSSGLESLSSP